MKIKNPYLRFLVLVFAPLWWPVWIFLQFAVITSLGLIGLLGLAIIRAWEDLTP